MKRTLTVFVIIILILTVFMSSALAAKPADKPNGNNGQGEDTQGEEPEGEEGPKKPNEKRDAKMLFREETRPLIEQIHANREEWGTLGDDQEGLDEIIDAQIDALIAGGLELPPETIALIKAKIIEIKYLKVQMRNFNRVIHSNWKKYIVAKKVSDIDAASAALTDLIAIQELRIEIRGQIVAIMNELASELGYVAEPVPEAVVPEA